MQNDISNWQQLSYVCFMAEVKPDQNGICLSPLTTTIMFPEIRFHQAQPERVGLHRGRWKQQIFVF